jgi:Tol biopolymer transport system component
VSYCGDIFVMRPDGTGVTMLSETDASDCLSSWSSDDHILFSSDCDSPSGENGLWVMNPDGSNPMLLTPFPGVKADPVLLPGV